MATHIRDNLYRLDIPLTGNPLKNLNSYLILSDDRSLLIDTGFNWPVCLEAMEKELSDIGIDRDRMDIYATHLHSDHVGLAAELIRPGCKVYISAIDEAGMILRDSDEWHQWYDRNLEDGFSLEEIESAKGYAPSQSGAPEKACEMTNVKDGDILEYGGHKLRCIHTPGHTPGHMCLYDDENRWFFSGDHILFTITPNICRWEVSRDSLGDYLDSLVKIRDLPVDLLLPAHREKSGELPERVDELLEHHKRRIENTLQVLRSIPGSNAYQIAGEMKWRISARNWAEFPLTQRFFAVGETLAHLDYLELRNVIRRETVDGINIYYSI